MQTHTTTSKDGTTLSYRVHGDGAQTIILVHGWMVSGAVYDALLPHLSDLDARLVIPDLRGAGASASGEDGYAIDRYAEDVAAIMDACGEDSVALVGHSMGGQIAQVVAARHAARVSKLALLCPVPTSGIPLPEEAVGLFSTSGEDRGKQDAILGMACLQLEDEDKEALLDDASELSKECIAESFAAWSAGGFQNELSDITATTLVVGTDDPFLPPEFLDAAVVGPIADASFVHIRGPGHYLQVEAPEATAATLLDFFS